MLAEVGHRKMSKSHPPKTKNKTSTPVKLEWQARFLLPPDRMEELNQIYKTMTLGTADPDSQEQGLLRNQKPASWPCAPPSPLPGGRWATREQYRKQSDTAASDRVTVTR